MNETEAADELARLRAQVSDLQAQLGAERERFRVAFEHSPVGIAVISLTAARYVDANRIFCEWVGMTKDELLAADPYEIWQRQTLPEDFDLDRVEFQRMVDGQIDGYQIVKRTVRPDGQVRMSLVGVHGSRDADGRLTYIIGQTVDMQAYHEAERARSELEERLRHALKLEALGRLAGGVAHDFNNRLAVITGHAELLRDLIQDQRPEQRALGEHLDAILTSATRSAELTRQLLAFGRRQVMLPRRFDLNETVDAMRKMLMRLLGDEITLHTTLGAKGAAYADPGQLEQVLLNLAVNARDAMPRGGRLYIETVDLPASEAPGELAPSDYLVLSVTDSGTGIPPDVLPHIFEPFYTTKAAGQGTGLGLATVDGIVRQSGGLVQVDSQPGQGTTFRVLLPAASATSGAVASGDELEPPHALRSVVERPNPALAPTTPLARVLLVEDDDAVRRLLVDVLALRSYEVLVARDGQHALELARAHPERIDAVVSDIAMPRMGGVALVRALRQRDPTLPALLVSGHVEPERLAELEQLEGVAHLAKPFSPTELLRSLDALLSGATSQLDAGAARRAH